MKLLVVNRSGRAMPQKFLQLWVRHMSRLGAKKIPSKKFRGKELVVVFVDEEEQRSLNHEYRGKDYATDVLSFTADPDLDPDSLGELIICPQVISRQAREHGLLVREELGYMVLHGFLHLLGYDHEQNERSAKAMFKLQDELFELLLVSVASSC
jgi:probable rRNA maturation factor